MNLTDIFDFLRSKSNIEIKMMVAAYAEKEKSYWAFTENHINLRELYSELSKKHHERREEAKETGELFVASKPGEKVIPPLNELFTTEQACAMLKIGKTTLFKLVNSGKLHPIKEEGKKRSPRNLYTKEDIHNLLRQFREKKNLK